MIIVNNGFIGIFVLGGWYWGLKKGYGVIGVVGWVAIARLIKLLMHVAVVYFRDWESVGRYGEERNNREESKEVHNKVIVGYESESI